MLKVKRSLPWGLNWFNPFSTKLKNSIFEVPVIPQTYNFNNKRTATVRYINLSVNRKLIEYSKKYLLMFECRSALSPAQWDTANEKIKYVSLTAVQRQNNLKIFWISLLAGWCNVIYFIKRVMIITINFH